MDLLEQIKIINNSIEKSIDKSKTERDFYSQVILKDLRTLVEIVIVYLHRIQTSDGKRTYNYDDIQNAIKNLNYNNDTRFLKVFHSYLQASLSHFRPNETNSTRLMLKYYDYIYNIKVLLKSHGIDIVENLHEFPLELEDTFDAYYTAICNCFNSKGNSRSGKYYINNVSVIKVGNKRFYQLSISECYDKTNNLDKFIVFSEIDIPTNYSVNLYLRDDIINVSGISMPVKIVTNWTIAIRPCELTKISKIVGCNKEIKGNKDYYNWMMYLTKNKMNLLDVVKFTDNDFQKVCSDNLNGLKYSIISEVLSKVRYHIKCNHDKNVLYYLIYYIRNEILKNQLPRNTEELNMYLNISNRVYPFEQLPFFNNLIQHIPKLETLLNCIDVHGKEDQIFGYFIKVESIFNNKLYIEFDDENKELIESLNLKIYKTTSKINIWNNYCNIRDYEEKTNCILELIHQYTDENINSDFADDIRNYVKLNKIDIEKEKLLKKLTYSSCIHAVFGAAGTGKSYTIDILCEIFNNKKLLILTNTYTALNNLRRKIKCSNIKFEVISKFKYKRTYTYDVLIVDECSNISNDDMLSVLEQNKFKQIFLFGDIMQIESINFGNWFRFYQYIFDKHSTELTKIFRAEDSTLLTLWSEVRNSEEKVDEFLSRGNFSSSSFEELFYYSSKKDAIILCLQYDGLYGINNLNRTLQAMNRNHSYSIRDNLYKINDPIIFVENSNDNLYYNNLKGNIISISSDHKHFYFKIQVFDYECYNILHSNYEKSGDNQYINLTITKYKKSKNQFDDYVNEVPFQIAYALSIHKSQGLEFDDVKIVITSDTEQNVDKNIFYTAITRSKKNLKIYWTPEVQRNISGKICINESKDDFYKFVNKIKLKNK
ncbi:MAG: ATP-dependent RecD-like DNA helicase [bacterium]